MQVQSNKTCFAWITRLPSIRTNNIMKMLMNNKFKAQTPTGNPTENLRCHVLVSHALNMPCSFGQSACSIESRCVVRRWLIYSFCVGCYSSTMPYLHPWEHFDLNRETRPFRTNLFSGLNVYLGQTNKNYWFVARAKHLRIKASLDKYPLGLV